MKTINGAIVQNKIAACDTLALALCTPAKASIPPPFMFRKLGLDLVSWKVWKHLLCQNIPMIMLSIAVSKCKPVQGKTGRVNS